MGFDLTDSLLGTNPLTGPAYWAYQLANRKGGGGGGAGFAPLPFDNGAGNNVDQAQIEAAFARTLGRAPRRDELDHFSQYIKDGDLSYNEIGQILEGLPEAQQARLNQYGDIYNQKLSASDSAVLGRASDAAASQMARLGRGNSSALGAQIASAGQSLAAQRQSALAAFYGNGLNDIASQYGQLSQGNTNRGFGLRDSRTDYNRSLMGYGTQRNDYMSLYNMQNDRNRRNAQMKAFGSLAGAGVGAAIGGPGGAQAGSKFGGDVVGLFGGY